MKILHTSDWHLGQVFYSYDRTDEYIHFFHQLKEIVESHHPDAMVVCGDIFDVSSPSSSIMRLFTDFILDLHEIAEGMAIIITSGNHDSASRIDVNRNLWKKAGIHVLGNVRRENGIYDFSENTIEIPGKGYIMAIPYINRAFMGNSDNETSAEESFFGMTADHLEKINSDNLPCVLMGHLTVEGCDMKGHKTGMIGNINSIKNTIFSNVYDYVALGHIHKAQKLDEEGRIRYSGTPIAVSFDEDYTHCVSIVDIKKGSSPSIEQMEIKPLRALKTFPEKPVDFKKALKLFTKIPDDDNSYIRLNVAQENDLPADCQELAAAVAADKDCRYCLIKYTRLNSLQNEKEMINMSSSQFAELNPNEIASRFFKASGIPDSQSEIYMSLLDQLQNEYSLENNL